MSILIHLGSNQVQTSCQTFYRLDPGKTGIVRRQRGFEMRIVSFDWASLTPIATPRVTKHSDGI